MTVDIQAVMQKVQQDPMGALLVRNAAQECLIERLNETISHLQDELVAKGRTEED